LLRVAWLTCKENCLLTTLLLYLIEKFFI
jgi:hypothetical protein